jgi:hypothetical protein
MNLPGFHYFAAAVLLASAAPASSPAQSFPLDSAEGLKAGNVKIEAATYLGRKAVRITPLGGGPRQSPAGPRQGGGPLAVLAGTAFQDGTIEIEVAGKPAANAPGEARGFVGVAFHVAPDSSKYDCFYIRPTNGRADDQERRNHSTQYISFPDWEWPKLRKETPGKYEAYADLVPGEWTRLKIEVRGEKARLYVNGAAQPTLLVNDLKLANTTGAVALWVGPGTEAHFSGLRLSK